MEIAMTDASSREWCTARVVVGPEHGLPRFFHAKPNGKTKYAKLPFFYEIDVDASELPAFSALLTRRFKNLAVLRCSATRRAVHCPTPELALWLHDSIVDHASLQLTA